MVILTQQCPLLFGQQTVLELTDVVAAFAAHRPPRILQNAIDQIECTVQVRVVELLDGRAVL